MNTRCAPVFAALILSAVAGPKSDPAQQVIGVPGSPDATRNRRCKQLPPPPVKFGGSSTSARTAPSHSGCPASNRRRAPNVLLIVTDDAGFGAPSAFSGVIPTPAPDRIPNMGLRYTQFHSTTLCAPTRAALITGGNHHTARFGVISELATGYPGYDSIV